MQRKLLILSFERRILRGCSYESPPKSMIDGWPLAIVQIILQHAIWSRVGFVCIFLVFRRPKYGYSQCKQAQNSCHTGIIKPSAFCACPANVSVLVSRLPDRIVSPTIILSDLSMGEELSVVCQYWLSQSVPITTLCISGISCPCSSLAKPSFFEASFLYSGNFLPKPSTKIFGCNSVLLICLALPTTCRNGRFSTCDAT